LNLKYDELRSNFDFIFNFHRYNAAPIWWQLLSQIQWLLMPVADLFFGSGLTKHAENP
jgi:hypothetical protein